MGRWLLSLRSWIAQRFLKRELARIAEGKEGPGMKKAFDWVMRNKKVLAAILTGVAGAMMAYTGSTEAQTAQVHDWAGYVMYAVAWLGGAGLHASDDAKAVEQGVKEATSGGLVKS